MPGPRVTIDAPWPRDAYVTRGMSLAAISAEAGVPMTTLHRRLKAYGIPARAPGRHSTRRDPRATAAEVLTATYLAKAQREGLTPSDIAKATGFGPDTVARHLRAHGLLQRQGRPRPEVDAGRLADLVTKGVPTSEIAALFGCSITTIKQRIIAYGIRAKAPAHRRYEMAPERLARMVAEGLTVVEMAAIFGCHHSTVSARIRRLGLR